LYCGSHVTRVKETETEKVRMRVKGTEKRRERG
jgi:hypothetical protein